MLLAKNVVDVGLSTNNLEPMLRFWQQDAGLRSSIHSTLVNLFFPIQDDIKYVDIDGHRLGCRSTERNHAFS